MGLLDLFKKKTDAEIEADKRRKESEAKAREAASALLDSMTPEIVRLLDKDCKMQAIKMVKDKTGMSLKDAKEFVEKIEAKNK